MASYKHILVGVDGSNAGFHALTEAIRLAQWSRGRVAAVTVCPSYDGDLSLVGVPDIKSVISGSCEKVANQVLKIGENLSANIEMVCSVGNPFEEIRRLAVEGRFDLVVLGRRRGLRAVFGSGTSYALIRHAPADLLVVPEQEEISWDRMLLVETSDGSDAGDLPYAACLANAYGGELTVMRVRNRPNTNVAISSKSPDIQSRITIPRLPSPGRIVARVKAGGIGLLVIGACRKPSLDLFLRPIWLRLVWYRSSCPTLMLKSDKSVSL
jgi:nucleotide-binding universal stress UspA family protein